MWKKCLNLLFPAKCIICDNYNTDAEICTDCWSRISFITKPYCALCSYPFSYESDAAAICGYCIIKKPKYDRAISLLKYDEHSKELMHKFKYHGQLHILAYLVQLMLNMGQDIIKEADIIAPVAMHKHKLLRRGYNQAALLSMKIAAKTDLQYCPELLVKKTDTVPQAGLKREQRLKNIKGSFAIHPQYIGGIKRKNILLIDDTIATGATISECCRILRKEKVAKIFVLTIAKRV